MKHHFCPTCEQPYACPRGEVNCGSPAVYDCMCCYRRRHRQELKALVGAVTARVAGDAHNGGASTATQMSHVLSTSPAHNNANSR